MLTQDELTQAAAQLRSAKDQVAAHEQTFQTVMAKAGKGQYRELARKLNVSPQWLCDITHGRRRPSYDFVRKIAELNNATS